MTHIGAPMTAAGLLVVVLAQSPGTAAAKSAWETLYEARGDGEGDGEYVASVWLKEDGTWRAGGKEVILTGDASGVATRSLPGHTALAFTTDRSGTVLAAGNNLAIWEERAGGFTLVQEKNGPRLKGRDALADELIAFARLDPERPQRLFAYGLERMLVSDGAGSTWQPVDDHALIQYANFGPTTGLPSGCHPMQWHQMTGRDGLLQCHEGRAFLLRGGSFTSIGSLPPRCAEQALRAALDGERLVMACGHEASRVWVRRTEGQPWSPLPRTPRVIDLSARNGCVLVATQHAVLRWCEPHSGLP